MTEIQRRNPEINRREEAMSRADAVRMEMASAVRVLGEKGRSADEANFIASRSASLSKTVIERLRWKKMRRVPADIADAIREALERHIASEEARARHENTILATRIAALADRARNSSDPIFHSSQIAGVVEQACRMGLLDRTGIEAGEDG